MNKTQTARIRCIKMICNEAVQHKKSVARISKFEAAIEREREICKEVDELRVLQEQDMKGITSDKDDTRDDLEILAIEVSGALESYAYEKKDKVLLEKIDYTKSQLEILRQAKLASATATIIQEAEAIPAEELLAEGISEKELSRLKKLHKQFEDKMNASRETTIERKNYTHKIALLVEEAWELKNSKLDKLVTQFKRKDPDFYLKYQAASQVIIKGRRRNGHSNEDESNEAEG